MDTITNVIAMLYFILLLNVEQETKARLELIKSYALEKIQHIKVFLKAFFNYVHFLTG